MTLQALSDQDRQEWLEAMDGKEPVYAQPVISKDTQVCVKPAATAAVTKLNNNNLYSFHFIFISIL